jgi:hypothetical protein
VPRQVRQAVEETRVAHSAPARGDMKRPHSSAPDMAVRTKRNHPHLTAWVPNPEQMSPSTADEDWVAWSSPAPDTSRSEVSHVDLAQQPALRDSRASARFRQGGEGGENAQPAQLDSRANARFRQGGEGGENGENKPLPRLDMARYGSSEGPPPAQAALEHGVVRDQEGRKVRGLFCWWCVGEMYSTATSWQWRPFQGGR